MSERAQDGQQMTLAAPTDNPSVINSCWTKRCWSRRVSVWKNHGEKTVYENPWLALNLADVELPDGRHHVYWSTTAEYVGHPEDDLESDRREWVLLSSVLALIERGEIRSANAVAALLLLHHMHAVG